MTAIDSDSAFNFQIAQSLSDDFSYQTRYAPAKVYHHLVTTNGPLQYFMAAMTGLFNLDLGRSIALGSIAGLTAIAIFLYSRRAFALYCLLLLCWRVFLEAHTHFWGELFAIAMIMIGLMAWEGWATQSLILTSIPIRKFRDLWRFSRLWLCGLFFGTAIATKLLAAPVILLLLICLARYRGARITISPPTKGALMGAWIIFPSVIAFTVFVLQFSFSILHSSGHLADIWPTLKLFVVSHFHQVEHATTLNSARWRPTADSIPACLVLIGLLVLLARRHLVFILAGVSIGALLFIGHLNLRRLLTLMVPVMLLAAKEIHLPNLVPEKTPRSPSGHSPLWMAGLILISGSFLSPSTANLTKTLSQFNHTGAPANVFNLPIIGGIHYNIRLLPLLKGLPGPIFTSGWWQFPEISLRAGAVFYDRFAPENEALLHRPGPHFLLFASENQADRNARALSIEEDLCGEILYRDGSLVLCQYRPL